jgi:hypothetical protein
VLVNARRPSISEGSKQCLPRLKGTAAASGVISESTGLIHWSTGHFVGMGMSMTLTLQIAISTIDEFPLETGRGANYNRSRPAEAGNWCSVLHSATMLRMDSSAGVCEDHGLHVYPSADDDDKSTVPAVMWRIADT